MSQSEPISIVVVESQPLMLTALSTALAAEGMDVLADVVERNRVIQTIRQLKPQLVLYSIDEPGLPDLERISALRHEFPRLLILALVSGDFTGQERMALDYGAHRVLTKSAPRSELLATLRQLSSDELPLVITKHVSSSAMRTIF